MIDGNDKGRLDDLTRRIHQAEEEAEISPVGSKPEPETEPYRSTINAYRVGTDFVVTVLVCGALGWGLDRWLGIAPGGLLIMTLVGFIIGMVNLWRAMNEGSVRKKD
jgi:ATP synthase protein I